VGAIGTVDTRTLWTIGPARDLVSTTPPRREAPYRVVGVIVGLACAMVAPVGEEGVLERWMR
jgi:hypothetical protein